MTGVGKMQKVVEKYYHHLPNLEQGNRRTESSPLVLASLSETHCLFQHLQSPFLWEGNAKVNRVAAISFLLPHTVCTGKVGGRKPGADLKPSGSLSLSELFK